MAIVKRKTKSTVRPAYPGGIPAAAPTLGPIGLAPVPTAPSAAELAAQRDLDERVERLRGEFAKLQWDLGGLAYEMAARNYFKLEVLREHAAELQRIDSELGEATRLSSIERSSAGGDCPKCGSLFGKGAFFCWNCGFSLETGAVPS